MSTKFGAKLIEFEKGKTGIVVPSKDKLPTVINTLIEAVRAGELDELFSQAAKRSGPINRHWGVFEHIPMAHPASLTLWIIRRISSYCLSLADRRVQPADR